MIVTIYKLERCFYTDKMDLDKFVFESSDERDMRLLQALLTTNPITREDFKKACMLHMINSWDTNTCCFLYQEDLQRVQTLVGRHLLEDMD